ncbi:MAG: hypothetical protein JRF53_19705 [Deltaproteobacteria bacterium]|nr:hypothetical protein [Deltaproteobacteria bacterium]
MKKKLVLMTVLLFGLAVVFASCAGMQAKPTEANFKSPKITLESFEVPQFDGYYYYSGKIKPTKGKAGNHGAPLPMSFVFNVNNPNPYPVLSEGVKFTVGFEGFDLVTYNNEDSIWIPAGKTTQIRATTLITTRSALLSLLVTGGYKLKAKGMNPWQAMEKWWAGVSGYATPIKVHEGAFIFKADGVTKVLPFSATFP